MLFYFFRCDDLPFINALQKTFHKNFSTHKMDEKKLHTGEFQLNRSSRNMRCKLLQKRFTGKTTECSKVMPHNAIEKNISSKLNRCIFQILSILSQLFQKYSLYWYCTILIFTSKLRERPSQQNYPPQQYNPLPKLKFLTAPQQKLTLRYAFKAQLKLIPLIQNLIQQDYLPETYARYLSSSPKCPKIVAPTRCRLFPLPCNLYG